MCLAIAMYILTATFGVLLKLITAIGIFLLNILGRTIYFTYSLFHTLLRMYTETELARSSADD